MGNVSLTQFGEGGGLLSDATVTFGEPQFIMGDYNGKMPAPIPMLSLPMVEVNEEGAEIEHLQLFSVGDAKSFAPDDTGKGLVKIGTKDAIVKTSTYAMFMNSIMDSGFPPERVTESIDFIKGIKAHVVRKTIKREGMAKENQEVLLVDKLYLDEKSKSGAGAKSGPKMGTGAKAGAKVDAGAADAAVIEEAKSVLIQVLASEAVQEAGSLAKNKLLVPVLGMIKDNPLKKEITKIITTDDFLNLKDGWEYDGGVLKLG